MTSILVERAPAKINLTLHVLGRRADGFHTLDSLVVFSGWGDVLRLVPGPVLSLAVDGPTAEGVDANEDNLVLRAARGLQLRCPDLQTGTFLLTKLLPVAAGIGGGSSDAAAALRLLARINGIAINDPIMLDAARAIGSDVPVCLVSRARRMSGAGERIGPMLELPPLFAVLVNPRVAVETPNVFTELALSKGQDIPDAQHPPVGSGISLRELNQLLAQTRNDLEPPALHLAPIIGDVLELVRAMPGCSLARMSGSGATVFGLFDNRRGAVEAARIIVRERPQWWARTAILR